MANKIYEVKSGGGGPALSVTMTLIFPKIVWKKLRHRDALGRGVKT